jgi:hypothetical protein
MQFHFTFINVDSSDVNEAPWFYIMIKGVFDLFSCLYVKITTFQLDNTTFCGLFDYIFIH